MLPRFSCTQPLGCVSCSQVAAGILYYTMHCTGWLLQVQGLECDVATLQPARHRLSANFLCSSTQCITASHTAQRLNYGGVDIGHATCSTFSGDVNDTDNCLTDQLVAKLHVMVTSHFYKSADGEPQPQIVMTHSLNDI